MNPRRAKRLCKKELLPRCVLDGLVECERAPHYRGSYIFVGERSGGSCDWPAGGPPRDGPLAVAVTVHNRDRGWIDATMNGTTECAGEGTTLPWTLRTVRGSCLAEGAAGDWCADATLTVEGLPPRTPNAPRPRAIMTFDLVFHEWAHPNTPACAIVYTGDLRIPRF